MDKIPESSTMRELRKEMNIEQRLLEARESIAQQPQAIREQLSAYFKETLDYDKKKDSP